MTPWWLDPMLFPLYVLGPGSLLLGAWLWARPASGSRWSLVGHLALAVFALSNAGYGAALLAGQEASTYWLPPLFNAGAYVLLVVLPSATFQRWSHCACRFLHSTSGRRSGAVLVLLGGMGVAAWMVINQADPSDLLSANDLLSAGMPVEESVKPDPIVPSPVCTDRGRVIGVSRVANHQDSLAQLYENQISLLQQYRLNDQVIHLPLGWQNCNCHGYVFTGGAYHIGGDDVPVILEDNGYSLTARPKAGDVVVYRDESGKVLHTGIVRGATGDGIVLVESKWGQIGRFVHRADTHCYREATSCLYYRSARKGNQLCGVYDNRPISTPTDEMYQYLDAATRRPVSTAMPAIETPEPRANLSSD